MTNDSTQATAPHKSVTPSNQYPGISYDELLRRFKCLELVTSHLALAQTPKAVADTLLHHILPILEAERGLFYLVSEDGKDLINVGMVGHSPAFLDTWKQIPLTFSVPLTDAFLRREPIALRNSAEQAAHYPNVLPIKDSENRALISLPMVIGDRPLGVIGLSFTAEPSFTADDIAFKQSIAHQCAIILDKIQTQSLLHNILDNSPAAIFVKDLEGRLLLVNRLVESKANASASELLGKTDHDLLPPEMADPICANDQAVLTSGEPNQIEEILPDREGTHTYLSVKFPLKNAEGAVIAIGGIATDITERKRQEAQFLRAQKMDGIGRLAGGIAHDFNNLLSVILGYTELIEEDLPTDHAAIDNLHNIKGAAQRAAKLTRQLLAFARRQPTTPKVIQPNELITNMEQMLKPLMREDILFQTRLDRNSGQVRIDPSQLEQSLINLVVNARDAMPGGGTLTLQTARVDLEEDTVHSHFVIPAGRYVLLSVLDTGTGMSEEVKARLFEPFFTTKEVGQGTGLGLATVYGIVKQNNGFVFVESELGKGSAFRIYLTRVGSEQADMLSTQDRSEPLPRLGTVLVVEDEPMLRDIAVLTLQRNGYHVLYAEDGVEALRVAEEYIGEIHLLLTDAIMPQMGGKELEDRLRHKRPTKQILIASGYAQDRFSGKDILPPNAVYLAKPYTPSSLLSKVLEVLRTNPRH